MSDINAYTTAEIANLTPQSGDLVLNTDDNAVQLWNGSAWKIFNSDVSPFLNGYSLDFDGSNDHAITTTYPIDMSDMANGYTFSAWMWRENDPNLASNGGTTSWLGGPCASVAYSSWNYPNLRWYLTDEYWNGAALKMIRWYHGGTNQVSDTTTLIPAGAWSHLAATWDGSSTVTIYLNGSQLAQITNASPLPTNQADMFMLGKGAFLHKGKVDEVGYWNRGLSSSDITAIYNSGTPGDLTSYSPVSWWRCGDDDGGTGTTVTDQGSGGHDLTVMNGATFSTSVPS